MNIGICAFTCVSVLVGVEVGGHMGVVTLYSIVSTLSSIRPNSGFCERKARLISYNKYSFLHIYVYSG